MAFSSELQLKDFATPLLKDEVASGKADVVDEFSYSAGRTDLVFTFKSDIYLRRRVEELGVDVPITRKGRLKAFLRLQRRGEITKEYYWSLGAVSRKQNEEYLEWLLKHGFAEETSRGKVRTAHYLRRHITKTVALELKLRKWRQALRQALRSRSFADEIYVVLDEAHTRPALKNIGEFEKSGIGLISISSQGDYKKHIAALKHKPFSELNAWKLNEDSLSKAYS